MLGKGYLLDYAKIDDIDSWIEMVKIVRNNFPGLETSEKMEEYRQTVIKNIERNTAICMKYEGVIVGILLFSYNSKCLSCMAVHPNHRRNGIATRQLYKKYGFKEDELVTEFDYPLQKFILYK